MWTILPQAVSANRVSDSAHRFALPAAAACGVAAAILFHFGYGNLAQYVALTASLALIYGANLDRTMRHRQRAFPILAPLFFLVVAGLLTWGRGEYFALLQKFDPLVQLIERWLNVRVPRDIVGALAMINGLLLFVWGTIKLSLANGIRLRDRFSPGNPSKALSGAYAFRPQRGWFLVPEWHFARHFLAAMTCLSLVELIACWQVFVGVASSAWVPVLPAALTVILGELAAYLGGRREVTGGIIFDGEDANAKPWANYEKVWVDLRRVWPQQWLAAGNRAPWGRRR
jgi:hypothetical protein